jgi:hypothetical protein
LYELALTEFEFSCYSVLIGLYRHSFLGLRIVLEYVVAGVHFSNYLLDFQEWVEDRYDLRWAVFVDHEEGPFSERYANAFFPEVKPEIPAMLTEVKSIYRDCSAYVHGEKGTQDLVAGKLAFNEPVFQEWNATVQRLAKVIAFILSLRYVSELKPMENQELVSRVMASLGHLECIRTKLGGVASD